MSGKNEYSPLGGGDLLPKRLESGEMANCEKYLGYVTLILTACTAIVCIAFGVKEHVQHVIMGAVVAAVGFQYFYICRLYKNDVLQDRKIVYLSTVITIAVCAVGLIYATSWKNPDPYKGCGTQFYSHASDSCLTFASQSPIRSSKCYQITGAYTANLLPNSFNSTTADCDSVLRWVTMCTGQQPKWECPKP